LGRIIKGEYTYFADGEPKVMESLTDVIFGKFCSIANNVIFDGGFQHNIKNISTFPFNVFFKDYCFKNTHPISKGDITVKNDVWIGINSVIMSGVTIDNGAVIGANSVVTRDVKPFEIVGGVPARHIKYRFPDNEIKILQRVQWWDWDINYIRRFSNVLMSDNIHQIEVIYDTIVNKL
jgi:virginiamycin A acetyltransferase